MKWLQRFWRGLQRTKRYRVATTAIAAFVGFILGEYVLVDVVKWLLEYPVTTTASPNLPWPKRFLYSALCAGFSGIVADWTILNLRRDRINVYDKLLRAIGMLFPSLENDLREDGKTVELIEGLTGERSELLRKAYGRIANESTALARVLNDSLAQPTAREYHDQIRIASLLCGLGKRRFWATSTDPTIHFQRENAFYYHALEAAAESYHDAIAKDGQNGQPPPLCRIFLCSTEMSEISIREYALDFLEMYRRHIIWSEPRHQKEPVRFFVYSHATMVQDMFQEAGLDADKALEDFMVVDNDFVYGRRGDYKRQNVSIRAIENKTEIERYENVFLKIYEKSFSVFELLKIKRDQHLCSSPEHSQYDELLDLCSYIREKASLRKDYADYFGDAERDGEMFYQRICQKLERCKCATLAVDVADQKFSRLWTAWKEQRSYQGFLEASHLSRQAGGWPYRLFVIDEPFPSEDREKATQFICDLLERGLSVGFLLRKDIVEIPAFKNRRFNVDFALDYLVTDVELKLVDGGETFNEVPADPDFLHRNHDALGFELFGKEPFIIELLDWERNLISRNSLQAKVADFVALWNSDYTSRAITNTESSMRELAEKITERITSQ